MLSQSKFRKHHFGILLFLFLFSFNSSFSQTISIDFSYKKKGKYIKKKYSLVHELLFVVLQDGMDVNDIEERLGNTFEIKSHRQNYLTLKAENSFSLEEAQRKVYEELGREKIAYVHPYLQPENGMRVTYLNEIVLKLDNGSSEKDLKNIFEVYSIKVKKIIPHTYLEGLFNVVLKEEEANRTLEIANQLLQIESVDFAYPEIYGLVILNTSDPQYPSQYALENNGTGSQLFGTPDADIDAPEAWALSTGSGVKVAVIDVGVKLNHPVLTGQLITGTNIENDGPVGGNPDITEANNDHGTAIAGIIAAKTNNNLDISGIAYDAQIIPIRVRTQGLLDDAISWAVNNANADVIVMSLSTQNNTPFAAVEMAIDDAVQNGRGGKGCIIVGASGNGSSSLVSYPANLLEVIAVGASNNTDNRRSSSNYGTNLDLVAPGDAITSLNLTGSQLWGYSGTSFAAPHVAAVAAMILEVAPNLTWQEVRHVLNSTTDKVSGYTYNINKASGTWANEVGYGRLNAKKAVDKALTACLTTLSDGTVQELTPFSSSQFSISGPSQICPSQTVMFTANYLPGVQGNVTGHTWTWPSTYTYIGGQGTRFLTIQAPSSTSGLGGAVTLRVTNACGTTSGSPAVKSFSPSFSCGFSFSLSPNPASQEVELAIEDNSEGEQLRTSPELLENYEVEISDMNGLVIYSKKAKAKKLKVNLNKMKKGLYNVNVIYKGEAKSTKLLISK